MRAICCEACGKEIYDDYCINLGGDNEYVCYHKDCIKDKLKALPDRYLAEILFDSIEYDREIDTPEVEEELPEWMACNDFSKAACYFGW